MILRLRYIILGLVVGWAVDPAIWMPSPYVRIITATALIAFTFSVAELLKEDSASQKLTSLKTRKGY